jgi:phosphocarrier protein HPr
MGQIANRTVKIVSDLGIHLRAAGLLVQIAGRFRCDVWIEKNGMRANGKSIMSVLALAASKGAELKITTEGDDADDALAAICGLIERGFEAS